MTTWRVLIEFQETKIAYLAHTPTEGQMHGHDNDRIYTVHRSMAFDRNLQLFIDAATPDEAQSKAKELLLRYVEAS